MKTFAVLLLFTAVSVLFLSLDPNQIVLPGIKNRSKNFLTSKEKSTISELLANSNFEKSCPSYLRDALISQNIQLKIPQSLENVKEVYVESDEADEVSKKIRICLNAISELKSGRSPGSKLNSTIVHENDQILVFLSLEDTKSKNRLWELGISIKKNPTKSL